VKVIGGDGRLNIGEEKSRGRKKTERSRRVMRLLQYSIP